MGKGISWEKIAKLRSGLGGDGKRQSRESFHFLTVLARIFGLPGARRGRVFLMCLAVVCDQGGPYPGAFEGSAAWFSLMIGCVAGRFHLYLAWTASTRSINSLTTSVISAKSSTPISWAAAMVLSLLSAFLIVAASFSGVSGF